MKIVLADDSQLILERLQELLHNIKDAQIVGLVKNGLEALEVIKTIEPDLVIIDINMPGLTGLQVIDSVRKENHKSKFLVLTLYASKNYRKKAMKLGANYFLSKTDDFEKVSELVRDLIQTEEKIGKL